MAERSADFVIIGAGIVGLTIALELKRRAPGACVVVLEKECAPGRHSSGRNSGVLHSGIYYPPASLKAKLCGQGALEMADYCRERGLPLNRIGKVLLPLHVSDATQLDLLEARAIANGVEALRLDSAAIRDVEPEARSVTGQALFVPSTSVVDPEKVMASIAAEADAAGIELLTGGHLDKVDSREGHLDWAGTRIAYGHVVNCAGLHADTVAHKFGVGHHFTLLPFKGIYWKLDPAAGLDIRHLIYPVPDLRVPFLGVHTTSAIDGSIYLGPTAVPAFGRENYRGLQGVTPVELVRILSLIGMQYALGRNGFRRLAWQEGRRCLKSHFAAAARQLLPRLRPEHLLGCDKVGLRAQMLDKRSGELVNDFVVEGGRSSTHVLNAVSPAFTSAFPFARYVCETSILT